MCVCVVRAYVSMCMCVVCVCVRCAYVSVWLCVVCSVYLCVCPCACDVCVVLVVDMIL